MVRILVVDDSPTCLAVAKACLQRWNFEVTTVTYPLQALSILHENEAEKSYDLVLADVHMPVMNGFELMRHVNEDFDLPVILISADDKMEMMCNGLSKGAPTYLIKPITADHVKHIWQFPILWKNKKKNTFRKISQENVPRGICSVTSSLPPITATDDHLRERKNEQMNWTPSLHNRFVEAILILGPKDAVPRKILEVMNAKSITREQVGSHLQKFKKFVERVMNGKTRSYDFRNHWIDCNYYSSIVQGNPNKILFSQLYETQRTGVLAAPIQVPLPLPPFNEAEASSSRTCNFKMSMPNNNASSSTNFVTPKPRDGGDNFQSSGDAVDRSAKVVPQRNCHLTSEQPFGVGCQDNVNIDQELGNVQLDPNLTSLVPLNEQAPRHGNGVVLTEHGGLMNDNAEVNSILTTTDNSIRGFDQGLNQEENWGDLFDIYGDHDQDYDYYM